MPGTKPPAFTSRTPALSRGSCQFPPQSSLLLPVRSAMLMTLPTAWQLSKLKGSLHAMSLTLTGSRPMLLRLRLPVSSSSLLLPLPNEPKLLLHVPSLRLTASIVLCALLLMTCKSWHADTSAAATVSADWSTLSVRYVAAVCRPTIPALNSKFIISNIRFFRYIKFSLALP